MQIQIRMHHRICNSISQLVASKPSSRDSAWQIQLHNSAAAPALLAFRMKLGFAFTTSNWSSNQFCEKKVLGRFFLLPILISHRGAVKWTGFSANGDIDHVATFYAGI